MLVEYLPYPLQSEVRVVNVRNPHAEKIRGKVVKIVGHSARTGAYAVEYAGVAYAPFRHEDFEKV